jgi:hypothetical protein
LLTFIEISRSFASFKNLSKHRLPVHFIGPCHNSFFGYCYIEFSLLEPKYRLEGCPSWRHYQLCSVDFMRRKWVIAQETTGD